MSYSNSELEILKDNASPSNFAVRSLSFFNSETGLLIEDAISIDSNGNMIIKDSHTELVISEATSLLNNVIEEKDKLDDELETIYFIDKENSKISLGELFENLFINKSFSGDRWFTQTRSLKLDYSIEATIKENYYTEIIDEQINLSGEIVNTIDTIENGLSQSNIWHSLPIEVITDDYVSNKYGIISAMIPMEYISTEGTSTVFRIFDATAGIELCRTNVFFPPVSKKAIINIPLTYQGPLPDSPIAKDSSNCDCITINELDNLELLNGKDKGSLVTKDQDGHFLVPVSRHIIKIQWQTCNIISDYLKDVSFSRNLNSNVNTSLSVDIYNNIQVNDEYIMLNGNFVIGDVINPENSHTIELDTTKYNFEDDYVISLGVSKNVTVYIVDKTSESFTLKWDKPHTDCQVNWKITKVIKGVDEDLTQLSNPDRELNYTLFKNKINNVVNRNICGDIDNCIAKYATYEFKEILPSGGQTEPFDDDQLIDGFREYTLYGYEDGNAINKTIKFYKSIDFPTYGNSFSPSSNTEYGNWRFSGIMKPGNNISLFYSPNEGYCSLPPVTYKLPIATVRIPKIKCNLCDNVNITYTLIISGSQTQKPIECGTSFFHATDSFGNVAYSEFDDFTFQVGLDTSDTTCTFEISGSSIVGSNDIVTVLKKITYDEVAYGDTYALSGAPAPEVGIFDPIDTPTFYDENVAFYTSENKISLNVPYDIDRYGRYFNPNDDRILKTTAEVSISGYQFNDFIVTEEKFLGQEIFGYQVVRFDPFLVSNPIEGELPLFPDFDPIGNYTTIDSIKNYINNGDVYYTNENFIPFPNFRIGNVTIDGSRYNPLLDFRNYRVVGSYYTYFGDTSFTPLELDIYKLTQNSVFELTNGERYKVVNDGSNTGLVDKGVIASINVKAYRSGRKFVPITDLFWDTFVDINGSVISY